jgi:hypothetical protein
MGRVTGLTLLAIVIIFGPLAWSDEFTPAGWALLLVDFWLLALLLIPAVLLQRILLGGPDWDLLRWWIAGAVLMLALDAAVGSWLSRVPWLIFVVWLAYVVARHSLRRHGGGQPMATRACLQRVLAR